MKRNVMKIDLQLFDGVVGAATGATPASAPTAESNTGAISQDAAEKPAEKTEIVYGKLPEEIDPEYHPASGESESEIQEQKLQNREAEFEELIKGEYKDLFEKRIQNIINRRISESKNHEKQSQAAEEIIGLIGMKYGVDASNIDALKSAIEEDDTYWEDAAEKENLTVEQYKKMKKIEAENAQLKKAKEEAARITQKEQIFSKWTQEAEGLKRLYPGFDMNTEMQNEQFLRLLGAGIDMRTTFETIHHEEILTGAMSYTAKQVAKKQADAIKSGQMRPNENGLSSRAAVTVKRDPSKFTPEDFAEIKRRVRAGQSIYL